MAEIFETGVLFYYIPDTNTKDVIDYLNTTIELRYKIDLFYEFISQLFLHNDVTIKISSHYIDPTDNNICVRLVVDKNTDEIVGYEYDYKKEEVKEKKSNDPSFGEVLFTTSLFFLTFLLGRASSPYKRFNPNRDKIKWPDMIKFGGNLEGVSKEDFYKVSDYYNDVFSETLRINNLYVCKGKKRRK